MKHREDVRVAYSIAEAAHVLSLGTTTVKQLVAAGEITSVRVGRRRLVPRSAVEAYVNRLIHEQTIAYAVRDRSRES